MREWRERSNFPNITKLHNGYSVMLHFYVFLSMSQHPLQGLLARNYWLLSAICNFPTKIATPLIKKPLSNYLVPLGNYSV